MPAIQLDPWQKAAECQRALRSATDSRERELLGYLQGMWLALANDVPFLTSDHLAAEMDLVARIHLDIHADIGATTPGVSQ